MARTSGVRRHLSPWRCLRASGQPREPWVFICFSHFNCVGRSGAAVQAANQPEPERGPRDALLQSLGASGAGDRLGFKTMQNGKITVHCQRQDYTERPTQLESTSLYTFFATYCKLPLGKRKSMLRFRRSHSQCKEHGVVERSVADLRVPVILGHQVPRADTNAEKNAFLKLVLFKPFRKGGDLKEPDQTWVQALAAFKQAAREAKMTQALKFMANLDAFHQGQSERDKEIRERRARGDDAWDRRDEYGGGDDYDGTNDYCDAIYDPTAADDCSATSSVVTPDFLRSLQGVRPPTKASPVLEAITSAQLKPVTAVSTSRAAAAPRLSVQMIDSGRGTVAIDHLACDSGDESDAETDADGKDGKDAAVPIASDGDGSVRAANSVSNADRLQHWTGLLQQLNDAV